MWCVWAFPISSLGTGTAGRRNGTADSDRKANSKLKSEDELVIEEFADEDVDEDVVAGLSSDDCAA